MAGFIVHTILYVEGMSGDDPGKVVNNPFKFDESSKLRDMWEGGKWEIVTFFHKQNGWACLKEWYE